MNNRGFGMNEFFLFIAIMCLSLLVTMVMYNKTINGLFGGSREVTYSDIENEMMSSARNYTDNYYYKVLEDGDNDYVTISVLEEEGILDKIMDPKNSKESCTGYVNFYKEDGHTSYVPYLRCGTNYQTNGYKAKYDVR